MRKLFVTILLVGAGVYVNGQSLQSPEEFLGYPPGERFTRHHRVVEYYEHVASIMPNVRIEQYGETNEYRPLIVAYVSSRENFDRLEEIRLNNLRRAGLAEGAVIEEEIAIVWLSYNVHGNESSSTEASMQTLYELANTSNPKTQQWLENSVVILDPCINPDGRDRYVNYYNQFGPKVPNPNLDGKEHREPWPGGRANHYLFDLNRDWAWLTQVETKQRIALYNRWMPHVHVDYHEQNLNNPYYFPPAAQPFHEIITPWQREFQDLIGQNHAKYFDENGWIYFTKEAFDLFYPGYGDTYPIFNGAIGMTYEKGGGGRAGLQARMSNGDTVKLSDRILQHHTTGLSTVEVSSVNAGRLVREFGNFYSSALNNPAATYKTYVVKGTNHPDKLKALTGWLDKHNITYGHASSENRRLTGFSYQTGNSVPVTISANDIVLSAYQAKSNLLTVLFEPQSRLVDSLTYDISAWAVPYVYDLEAYALKERIDVTTHHFEAKEFVKVEPNSKTYAYIGKYESLQDVKWLAWILKKGVKARVALKEFSIKGISYPMGTMIALRWDNEYLEKFDELMGEASEKFARSTTKVQSGLVGRGKDFGSRWYRLIEAPNIGVLGGSQVRSVDFGEVWFYFENEIEYPVTVIDTEYFNKIDLDNYDVLVIPGGSYRIFNEEKRKELTEWIGNGGRLVIMSKALESFVDTDEFSLKKYASDEARYDAEKKEQELKEKEILSRFEDERRNRANGMPGAIYKVQMDSSHPLAFGYSNTYHTLKRSSDRYAYLEDGGNVGVIESSASLVSGFVGLKIKESIGETLVFGYEKMGDGSVVYMVDNPLFRTFWYSGKMIFGNAVFIH